MSFLLNKNDLTVLDSFINKVREGTSPTAADLATLKHFLVKMETEACTIHDAQELLEWEKSINDFERIIQAVEARIKAN